MTDTARDIITEALLDLGVLAEGETPTSIQANGALKKLNALLDSWSLDNLMIYGTTANQMPLIANKTFYTIGTGGDLNIPRPNNIISASVYDNTQSIENRIEYTIPIYNDLEWAELNQKGLQGAFPAYAVYFNFEYPFIKAFVSPVPDNSQYTMIIYTSGILSNIDLDTVLSLPSGYRRALVSSLSIELSPSYGVEVSPATVAIAESSLKLIMNKNLRVNELISPFGGNVYDWRTDRYR